MIQLCKQVHLAPDRRRSHQVDLDTFRVGMGVVVTDQRTGGFSTTTGTITRIKGNALFIDKPFNADYHASREGHVVSVYPLVSAEDVRKSRETATTSACRLTTQ